ncbi:HalOD1 output domain-containing protein [Halosimplex marinum]|uniref:HalOD1 output domain-containing protein n=1 Tax=Halosimplex marinum TaxID=3396620 RepID=UPI003F567183
MTASTRVPDDPPIARAAVGADEDATDALLRAARRAHLDLDEVDSLHGRIDAGALDALVAHHRRRDTDGEFTLAVDLWGHTFVVRPDAVEVYN